MTPCPDCGGTGWKVIQRGNTEGVAKCTCRQQSQSRTTGRPVTPEALAVALKGLAALDYFPPDEITQGFIGRELASMCSTAEQLQVVATIAPRIYRRWGDCGMAGLRQILCRFHKPKDGIEVSGTDAYPDGIPDSALGIPERPQIDYKNLEKLPPAREEDGELLRPAIEAVKRRTEGKPPAPLPSEDEIASIKRQQSERAKEAATRDILEGKAKSAGEGEGDGTA